MTLDRKARAFVNTLSDVLNRTVTDGIRITYKGHRSGAAGSVGFKLTRDDLVGQPIPITLGRNPSCWLLLNQTVTLEEDGHLETLRGRMAVYADEKGDHSLFRYDFDREADNPYPVAHVQVSAESEAVRILADRCGISPVLEDLHLPVGGVRFRPALEDIIEFLIVERIADSRDGWREAVQGARNDFYRIQLRAAVRRHPEIAAEQLEENGIQHHPTARRLSCATPAVHLSTSDGRRGFFRVGSQLTGRR